MLAPARQTFLTRMTRHRLGVLGLVVIGILLLACYALPAVLPFDPLAVDIAQRMSPPMTNGHLFGSDPLGRDTMTRLLVAGRTSLTVAFLAMLIGVAVGIGVGLIAGYFGGWTGALLMRIVDAFLSFPSIFLLLVLAAFLQPGVLTLILIIGAAAWMEVARIVAAQAQSLRERDFVLAAKMAGASSGHIVFREVFPNALAPIVVAATLTVARAVLAEAYISFLGFGIQPPTPSWGNMLNSAQQYLVTAPWLAIFPGLMITIAVLGFNFVGDALRDAADPRTRR